MPVLGKLCLTGYPPSYLAHCYPYKYTDLIEDLKHLKADPVRSKCLSERVLCQTLAGNDVPVVTITSHKSAGDVKYKQGKQGQTELLMSKYYIIKL